MWVDKAGDSCGEYTIVKELGRGGSSVVKLVEKNNQLYAMKIFKTEKFNAKCIELVQQEMKLVDGLKLKNVPNYYDFKEGEYIKKNGKSKKVFYLVMDYIDGVTLFDFFFKVGKPEDKFLRYVFQKVAYCLFKLH